MPRKAGEPTPRRKPRSMEQGFVPHEINFTPEEYVQLTYLQKCCLWCLNGNCLKCQNNSTKWASCACWKDRHDGYEWPKDFNPQWQPGQMVKAARARIARKRQRPNSEGWIDVR